MLRSRAWASVVLGWFLLGLGMAAAAPLLQAAPMQVVCSANGEFRLVTADGSAWDDPAQVHVLHCPFCLLGAGAAPAQPSPGISLITAAATPVPRQPDTAPVPRQRSGAPLPARGPPASS